MLHCPELTVHFPHGEQVVGSLQNDCLSVRSMAAKERNRVEREKSREGRNAKFAKNGYRWACQDRWVLKDPQGLSVSPADAERAIEQKWWDERSGWEELS